jgi:hypothetical protein
MKRDLTYLKVDARNRVSLTKVSPNLAAMYRARLDGNKIILEPIQEVPEAEAWLFLPENKEILEKVKRGLKQKATTKWSSIKKKYE